MKLGKTINDLAKEINLQNQNKEDLIASTSYMDVHSNGRLRLQISGQENQTYIFPCQNLAIHQISERVGIPARYTTRMLQDAPNLLATNINYWFKSKPEKRMIRTLFGECRAFLSDRYQRIDNYDVANVVLPILMETPGLFIKSTEITEKRMYIKAVSNSNHVQGEVKPGDIVQAGVVISNSEVGFGAIQVQPLVFRLICSNGLILPDHRFRRHHVGTKTRIGDANYEFLRNDTLKADDRALLLKIRDIVMASLDRQIFQRNLEKIQRIAQDKIEGKVDKTVQVLGKSTGLTNEEQDGVLKYLIEGGDLSRWGLVNAVTRFSQNLESYDRATEFESIGGSIINLPSRDWNLIAQTN